MKIGIDARMLGFAPGIGRYIEELSQRLFTMDQENEYIVFLREPVFSAYQPGSPRVRKVLALERWYSFSEQLLWPWRIRREKLDLLVVPQFNVPLFVPCPFIVTIHDVTQLYVPGALQKKSFLHRWAFRLVFGHAVKKARAVIAVSHYTKKEILKNFRVDAAKIYVIYEGTGLTPKGQGKDPNFLAPGRAGGQTKFQIPNTPYILAVGVWRPHKNFEGLLQAFALLKKDKHFADLKLVLAGEEDPRYPKVRESIGKLGLAHYTLTPGTPGDRELEEWYKEARLLVAPSFFEGFGLVGLEALARGVPVAASNAAALPEILGDAACYFDPRDTNEMALVIETLLVDESERKRILAAAPAVLSRYSWDRAARETLTLLTKTTNESSR